MPQRKTHRWTHLWGLQKSSKFQVHRFGGAQKIRLNIATDINCSFGAVKQSPNFQARGYRRMPNTIKNYCFVFGPPLGSKLPGDLQM